MRILLAIAGLIVLPLMGAEEVKAFPSIPKYMLKTTHRLAVHKNGTSKHGTAVAVDLSRFGLDGANYLLTAAHCVVEKGRPIKAILIEIKRRDWVDAEVIAFDEDLDIAILKAESAMPELADLAAEDTLEEGSALITIGSPRAMPLTANHGFLSDKGDSRFNDARAKWYIGGMAITHGNSGGPVFCPNTKKLVGIVTAIWEEFGESAPNIAYFVAAPDINEFLTKNKEKIKKKK